MSIPVLLYHSVAAGTGTWGAVTPELFAAHVEAMVASGRQAITEAELADGLRGQTPLPPRPLVVTFDDGYGDTPRAVAQLNRAGIPSIVYVTAGTVGAPGYIDDQGLTRLAATAGVDIGAHSVTHPHLDELRGEELGYELGHSRARLESLTGRRVESFAYPYGAFDGRVRAAVVSAGYRSAVAVKNAFSHPGDDPFAIARLTVTGATSAEHLGALLDGRGARAAWRGERLRTRAHRIVRRGRRRLGAGRRGAC